MIIRVTKKCTDKLKNRLCNDVQGRFEVGILSYFSEKFDKILYREMCLYNTQSAQPGSASP